MIKSISYSVQASVKSSSIAIYTVELLIFLHCEAGPGQSFGKKLRNAQIYANEQRQDVMGVQKEILEA